MENQEITLTEGEIEVLLAIWFDDHQEGDSEDKINNAIWMIQECDTTLKGKPLSGTCSSLSKKGLMGVQKDGKNSTCWITKLGYETLLKNGHII